MPEKRSLLIGGVALGKGRLKNSGAAVMQARNEMEQHLVDNSYLETAPFKTINMIFRYGDKDDWDPEIGNIDTRNGELPVAIEFDVSKLKTMNVEEMKSWFRLSLIEVLCDIAANYDLPYEFLDKLRD
ncbi:immunity protein 39 [Marinobacter hydrocarbonoclasticus]|uniref:Imm39 family immunity protein n=1 Tax=Marinobacter nauticus TaxID=2743 RepID=UPI001A8D445D|nr:Imm39 family immunity protein [Marinobacter nauticus]MBN8241246.1 immunity protein 39 [Marinobacter nauticus]